MICRVALKSSKNGKVDKDDRSESDASEDYQDEVKKESVDGASEERLATQTSIQRSHRRGR